MSNTKLTLPTAEAANTVRPFMTVQAGDRLEGTCHYCNRSGFKLNGQGRLSRHGFTRPQGWGSEHGRCAGSGLFPEATLNRLIDALHSEKGNVERLLATDLREFALRQVRFEIREASRAIRYPSRFNPKHLEKRNDHFQPRKRAEAAKLVRDLRANTVLEGEGSGAYRAYNSVLQFTPAKLRQKLEKQLGVIEAAIERSKKVVADAREAGAEVVRFVPRPQLINRA